MVSASRLQYRLGSSNCFWAASVWILPRHPPCLSNLFIHWFLQVGDTNNWTVGVAAQSVSRRAEFEACPEAGLWCISLREGEYLALTTAAQTLNAHHLNRVRVRLDWDEGTLEFMNADTDTHLFMFRHRFTEKVYPYFESVSSCGGFTVLAQRVKVSVGSDYVPMEDTSITEHDLVMKSESCTEGDIDAASTQSNGKMSECGRLTENKNLSICSMREKKNKPQRCTTKDQLIKTKPTGKEKTNNKPAVQKQSSKPRFSVTYHVSLNRAHQQWIWSRWIMLIIWFIISVLNNKSLHPYWIIMPCFSLVISNASSMALGMAMSATTLVQAEISQQRIDWVPWNFPQTFTFPRGWIRMTLVISWLCEISQQLC